MSESPSTSHSTASPTGGATRFASPWVQLRSASMHPFVYQRMIDRSDAAARPGDVVTVYDRGGRYFGRALFNPRSQIVLRMLTHGSTAIDDTFWRERLSHAISLRSQLRLDDQTDAYRLVHAEGDQLSGLIAERYGDCVVLELFSLGMFQRVEILARFLCEQLGAPTCLDRPGKTPAAWRIVTRADQQIEGIEGFRVPTVEDAPTSVVVREHGIRYRIDLQFGHKTGFFCDQRENRRRAAALCRDASVLDLCCYTGGFGLAARRLGAAREVTGVDLDEKAIAVARENANLNQERIDFVHADAFVYLRQMRDNQRRFDVVILDPPKFATSRAVYDDAIRQYSDLNTLAMGAVRSGGFFVTCSCSGLVGRSEFIETVVRAARRAGRTIQLLDQSGAGPDHPVAPNCPESAYLKVLWLRVL